jgi:hypothetical protein
VRTSDSHFYYFSCLHLLILYTHTRLRTYTYTCMHSYIHTYVHTYICTYIRTYIHTYIHTHTNTQTYIYIYVHTYTRTYIHTYVRTYIHTYTHTHTNIFISYLTLYDPVVTIRTIRFKNKKFYVLLTQCIYVSIRNSVKTDFFLLHY